MGAAAELRNRIESALAGRIPSALSPRPLRSPELVSCGLAEVDALLGGGLPLGAIVELIGVHSTSAKCGQTWGPGSSGRTTLALSTLAGLTRRGHCCAYVDACDALDPLSAAALGVELRRLLWVRPPVPGPPKMKSGVPGEPSIGSLGRSRVPRFCPPLAEVGSTRSVKANPYLRLDCVLRAADLLLNAGGWAAVVLDFGELPAVQVRRVPLATWYRFRLQAEKSRTLLLLLTPLACANSCAALSLHSEKTQAEWRRIAKDGPALLAELRYSVRVSRSRAANHVDKNSPPRKPPASDRPMRSSDQTWWTSTLSWPG